MSKAWKTPDEIIRLQLLNKKKALQARIIKKHEEPCTDKQSKLEAVCTTKRKNPFSKNPENLAKKSKTELNLEASNNDTVLQLLHHGSSTTRTKSAEAIQSIPVSVKSFPSFNNDAEDVEDPVEPEKFSPFLPMDWSIKTRMRILCQTQLPGSNPKSSQEISGLLGFVRCIDPQNTAPALDISLGARFQQSTYYWQHPHIPWLTLFPRKSKLNASYKIDESQKAFLAKEWTESFRSLFQLLRSRKCSYFYLCANTFTVLFRAAGIGGRTETHALLSPTSTGLRSMLKQEGVEYSQPLRSKNLNKSDDKNVSLTKDENFNPETNNENDICEANTEDNEDDVEEENWLRSLGVEESEIKKISSVHAKETLSKEMAQDFSDRSIALIEGVDCQAFFNFLLNAKSTVANFGQLAGVPPTLLAPIAYPGATLRSLQLRSSKVRVDGIDYFSTELNGVILPHVLPYICNLLVESKDSFNVTTVTHITTLSFTKASQKLVSDIEKEEESAADQIFRVENLADCGFSSAIVGSMCRVGPNAVSIMDRINYKKDIDGFTWS